MGAMVNENVGGVAPSDNIQLSNFWETLGALKCTVGMCYKVGEESDFNTSAVNLSSR